MGKSDSNKLSSSELSFFCMQVAMILKSGMLIADGIDWMFQDIKEGKLKQALHELKKHLNNNLPLYKAMEATGYFPSYMVNMSQLGSVTGKLEEVMNSLSDYYEREDYLKSKIRNSIFYPSMLFVMMSFILILLVTKIFPILEGMLKELGGTVSQSDFFISFDSGIAAGRTAMVFVIAVILLMVLLLVFYRTNKGRISINSFLNSFPLTKPIMERITAYRFSFAMSLLLSSGMNIDTSLEMLLDIIEEPVVREKIQSCSSLMKSGKSFLDSLLELSIFSSIHLQMLKTGQRTGELDVAMSKLTNIYEYEADQAISNAVGLVEPVLVGILALVTGIILISVMLPLMNIMSSIG
ncbi:MAG TPA: type II secretion system F family protein [Tissierellia bacterium]|jgi:type IV pilus assembly protein PilC|nr:type II secretion system F family protein [Tissierellia bacterium]